jgi:hypothetical protein
MKIEDAIKRSIKAFRAGEMPRNLGESMDEEIRYTPEFFDEIEKELGLESEKDGDS